MWLGLESLNLKLLNLLFEQPDVYAPVKLCTVCSVQGYGFSDMFSSSLLSTKSNWEKE